MSDQGSTRSIAEQRIIDAARDLAERFGAPTKSGEAWLREYDEQLWRDRAGTWLRTDEAHAVIARCVGDHLGFCDGHQRGYPDVAAHLLVELAKAVEGA